VQQQAAQGGIDEQRRQFDEITKLLSPYTQAGAGALTAQQALAGLGGPEAERAAIARISGGETYKALAQQGEEALLQRASATGGLRGGNIQAALGQFRPQLLSSLIEQQYGRLGGITDVGQASAARQAAFGQQTGANVSNLIGQRGSAQAGGILGEQSALTGGITQAFGAIQGAGGFGKLFGGGGTGQSGMYADPTLIPMQAGGGF
jgi:hypothetical protein